MPAPWSPIAVTSDDLFRDINATFQSTYRKTLGPSPKLSRCMRLGVPSQKRKERYGYAESVPTVDRWERGEAVAEDGNRLVAYEVENVNWGKAMSFFEDDLEDLTLGDLREIARQLAVRAAKLPQDVLFQMITGSASTRLLEAIPLAPDGAGLYASTANGAARFGVSGGNIQSGSGVASGAAVRSDLWNVIERFTLFQDTEGEELLPDDICERGLTIVYGAQNSEVFMDAFKQNPSAIGPNTATSNAAVQNTIVMSGIPITLWPTQKITDNDWTVWINGADEFGPPPTFEQVRQAPRMIEENRENSERARRYRIFATILDMRAGFGINLPYLTCKVNN